ncbi:hypothetical protein [Streptomyces sp. YGL11-2]|uniref:hypothetical protein n=1 Tax=Streptomyces sp. YGL11-2 TaxID=3414028 RepID=UPI003CFB2545
MDPALTEWVPDLLRKRKRNLSDTMSSGAGSAPDSTDDGRTLARTGCTIRGRLKTIGSETTMYVGLFEFFAGL